MDQGEAWKQKPKKIDEKSEIRKKLILQKSDTELKEPELFCMYYNKIQSISPQSIFLQHNVFYYSILYYDLLSDAGC